MLKLDISITVITSSIVSIKIKYYKNVSKQDASYVVGSSSTHINGLYFYFFVLISRWSLALSFALQHRLSLLYNILGNYNKHTHVNHSCNFTKNSMKYNKRNKFNQHFQRASPIRNNRNIVLCFIWTFVLSSGFPYFIL